MGMPEAHAGRERDGLFERQLLNQFLEVRLRDVRGRHSRCVVRACRENHPRFTKRLVSQPLRLYSPVAHDSRCWGGLQDRHGAPDGESVRGIVPVIIRRHEPERKPEVSLANDYSAKRLGAIQIN